MQVSITPRSENERGGYACLPLKKNVPQGREGWKLVQCPECGQDCWETPAFRKIKNNDVKGTCTLCALKKF